MAQEEPETTQLPAPSRSETPLAAAVSVVLGLLAVVASPYIGVIVMAMLDHAGLGWRPLVLPSFVSGALVGLVIQAVLLVMFRRVRFLPLLLANLAVAACVYVVASLSRQSGLAGMIHDFFPVALAGYLVASLPFGPTWRARLTAGSSHGSSRTR